MPVPGGLLAIWLFLALLYWAWILVVGAALLGPLRTNGLRFTLGALAYLGVVALLLWVSSLFETTQLWIFLPVVMPFLMAYDALFS